MTQPFNIADDLTYTADLTEELFWKRYELADKQVKEFKAAGQELLPAIALINDTHLYFDTWNEAAQYLGLNYITTRLLSMGVIKLHNVSVPEGVISVGTILNTPFDRKRREKLCSENNIRVVNMSEQLSVA